MSFIATEPFDLPFLPPVEIILSDRLHKSLLDARTQLAELKGYSMALPNPLLLLSPAILKEAVASSEIENINTTIEGVLQQVLFPETEQRTENKEVIRYKEAVLHGFNNIGSLSIGNRLIRDVHKILLGNRSYGYRKLQNHLESSSKKIIYTPPASIKIDGLIQNWETYVHNTADNTDPLLKCIISHYQFEAIHPFNDGNGRTGRILMVLFLVYTNLLHFPILYISGYINKYRAQYYTLLQNVTEKGEWLPYIEYMLDGFFIQAASTKAQLFKMMSLLYKTKSRMKKECQNVYSADLVELLFSSPIITPVKFGGLMNIHYTTATRYLKELESKNFLIHKKVGKYQLYINKQLIETLEADTELNQEN